MPEDQILEALKQFQAIEEQMFTRTERITENHRSMLVEWRQFLEKHDANAREATEEGRRFMAEQRTANQEISNLVKRAMDTQQARQSWWEKVIVPLVVAILTLLGVWAGQNRERVIVRADAVQKAALAAKSE